MPTKVTRRKGVYIHNWTPEPGRPEHAELAPSDATRWLVCAGAVQLTKKLRKKLLIPPDYGGKAAAQGTLAHWINEQPEKPEHYLGQKHRVEGYTFTVDHQMNEGCNLWRETIKEIKAIEDIVDDKVEYWTDLTKYKIKGLDGGTIDRLMYNKTDQRVHVIDFKYGFGYVDERSTPQLRIYAVGALDVYPKAKEFVITIVQPRTTYGDKVREFRISRRDLTLWRDNVMIPRATAAADKKNKRLTISENACKYCDNKDHCSAKKQLVELVQTPAELLTAGEKLLVFRNKALIEHTIKQVTKDLEYMLRNDKDIVSGLLLKMVRKRTRRAIDEEKLVKLVNKKRAYKRVPLNVTETIELGRQYDIDVSEAIYYPVGEPEVAVVEDPREQIGVNDFANLDN